MVQEWASYFTTLSDKVASIFVDLGLRHDAPLRSNPWRLRVRIHLTLARPDGLSHSEEAPTLFLIEDALNLQLERECGGVPCGRITGRDMREFCFYARTSKGFRPAVATALAGFPGHRFEVAEKQDPDWEYYFNVLYPSPEELEQIKNRGLLDVLLKGGDVLSIPREVQHWAYFPSEECRQLFRNAAGNVGFEIGYESQGKGNLPFGLTVFRTQAIVQELIDQTTIELLRLAKRFGGEYDGWETPVTTQ